MGNYILDYRMRRAHRACWRFGAGTVQNNETEGAAWLSNMVSSKFHVDIGPPEDSPIPGAQYAFPQKMVKIDAVAGFRDLQLPQLDGLVIALDWVANDRHHIWGSAVMVAPGVALTAGHVIDEMRCRGFLAEAGGQLWAISVHADRVELWRADSFTRVDISDLSLLTLVRTTAASGPPADLPEVQLGANGRAHAVRWGDYQPCRLQSRRGLL